MMLFWSGLLSKYSLIVLQTCLNNVKKINKIDKNEQSENPDRKIILILI